MRAIGLVAVLFLVFGCEESNDKEKASVFGEWKLTRLFIDDGTEDGRSSLADESLYLTLRLNDDYTFNWISKGLFSDEEFVASEEWHKDDKYIYLWAGEAENEFFRYEYNVTSENLTLINDQSWLQENGEMSVWILTFYFDRQ